MAGNEGTSQTELWSSVVHQPCEDPEESELPSTVDMAAFSSGLTVESTNASQNHENSDSDSDSEPDSSNSGSEGCQSSSQSDSSDSDSSTSSVGSSSRSSTPEFSVRSSQTNGLRLTIATVRKSTSSPPVEKMAKSEPKQEKAELKSDKNEPRQSKNESLASLKSEPRQKLVKAGDSVGKSEDKKCKNDETRSKSVERSKNRDNKSKSKSRESSSSSESACSSESESELEVAKVQIKGSSVKNGREVVRRGMRLRSKVGEKKEEKKTGKKEALGKSGGRIRRQRKAKKMAASLPLSRTSACSTSETDSDADSCDADRAILASCSLQEIRQEDLAAILPDQQECDAFEFECGVNGRTDKNSPMVAGGDVSGSDMELPQQAVNALIQRTTESSSESECHAPPNPSTLYANSLLQQFVAQTQMLNCQCAKTSEAKAPATAPEAHEAQARATEDPIRRKRGRPRKNNQAAKKTQKKPEFSGDFPTAPKSEKNEYSGDPNVSPDSGIQNSPDHVSSPEPTLRKDEAKKKVAKQVKKEPAKISVTSNRFDRLLYANTDRVLYPPRRRVGRPPVVKKGPGRPPKHKHTETEKNDKSAQKKLESRPVLVAKNKNDNSKVKYATLKNLKVMHSRHKHGKHKKYKIKILKPLTGDSGKVVVEIDKLVSDFVKFCVIGSHKQPKENIPATAKKVSKKRKTTEHSERKKKKIHVNATVNKVANLNEQRLPLKKRHYLFSDGKINAKQTKEETKVKQKEEVKVKKEEIKVKQKEEVKVKQKEEVKVKQKEEVKEEEKIKSNNNNSITATTPKKRHRLEVINKEKESPNSEATSPENQKSKPKLSLETLITELKMKRGLSNKNSSVSEKDEGNVKVEEMLEAVVKVDIMVEPQKTPESAKKKIRKRRNFNRTGFPTVKRKKKKLILPVEESPSIEKQTHSASSPACDRVPKDGEEYNKFIQRTEKIDKVEEDSMSKWEVMSECDSLPLDERIDDKGDEDDLEEMSLEASIERLRSRLDKRKRRKCTEKISDNLNGYPKRRLREISPASSIEPLIERRIKDERASASGDERKTKKAPRWRKRYLVAGLFSDYFKEDDETMRIKRHENATKSSRLVYNPSEHPYGLLPPPYHCGRYLRCRKLPFQLSHDLWWQHTHAQLPGRDVVPSWNYRKIRTNVYNVKNTTGTCEAQNCNCSVESNCGDDCINRLVLAECPAYHKCQNQKIQRHEWAPGIEKFMTEDKGWGVRTKLPIKTSEFILEYVGEVVSDQEFKQRMASIYVNDTHHYCLHLDGGLLIDGHRMGGDGRFVNHSCEPNCEMQKWSVNGQFRMALFALRDIESGEELTYDYNFSLFNPAEGQECKCGSEMCRGVIGGKSQRVRQLPAEVKEKESKHQNGRLGRPRKNRAKRAQTAAKEAPVAVQQQQQLVALPVLPLVQVKLSHQARCFVLERHCFLLRNLNKVKKVRDKSTSATPVLSRQQTCTPTPTPSGFITQLNALEKPRNMRTRRLAQAEDNPELTKTLKLASLLKEIFTVLIKAKDENNESLSSHFLSAPSKRKVPEFYQRIKNPIDLNGIEQKVAQGAYQTPESFDTDVNLLFTNYLRFYGRTNKVGVAAVKLRRVYVETKQQSLGKFEDVLGRKPPPEFVRSKGRSKDEEEDIIRCICGMPRDEGLMIQCERCMVWQHCECVKADVSAESYHCEQCVPRDVNYEIPLDEFTEHGHRYFMTLLRDDLQLRQGDTVYVLRDIPIPGTNKKHTYDTIGKIDYSDLDIFRIERLWKDSKTGQRFAYGHHYLRPHETYHEPTRKFFPNEVMRVPLYEAVPVELVIRHCWVLDTNTFCKGRPIGAPEEHIYICEYRVDKSARLFSKVSKSKFPTCTKSFVFERFETRLKVSRTYTPHDLDPGMIKPRGKKPQEAEGKEVVVQQQMPIHVPIVRTPTEQKARLNKILLNLLSKMPTKQPLDVSYLLEGGRRRKKQVENKH